MYNSSQVSIRFLVVQQGRWCKGDIVRVDFFSVEEETKILSWEQDMFYTRVVSGVKRAEFVSDRMSYIDLRGCCCNVIVLNVHAPGEEKCDDSKDSFYDELEQVFDHFLSTILKFC